MYKNEISLFFIFHIFNIDKIVSNEFIIEFYILTLITGTSKTVIVRN